MLTRNDPCAEDAASQAQQAIVTVHTARAELDRLADQLPALRGPLADFAAALEAVESAYRKSPDAYRATRALPVVHLPAMLRILRALTERDDAEVDPAVIAEVRGQLTACLDETRTAIAPVSDTDTSDFDAEMAVLSDALGLSEAPDRASRTGALAGQAAGLAGRAGSALARRTGQIAGEAAASLSRRAAGGRDLALSYVTGAVADGVGRVTGPIETRLTAASRTAWDATIGAVLDADFWSLLLVNRITQWDVALYLSSDASRSDTLRPLITLCLCQYR